MKLADAEKLNGNTHWTVYDGQGNIYRAKRDAFTRGWQALRVVGEGNQAWFCAPTLRELRVRIALS